MGRSVKTEHGQATEVGVGAGQDRVRDAAVAVPLVLPVQALTGVPTDRRARGPWNPVRHPGSPVGGALEKLGHFSVSDRTSFGVHRRTEGRGPHAQPGRGPSRWQQGREVGRLPHSPRGQQVSSGAPVQASN